MGRIEWIVWAVVGVLGLVVLAWSFQGMMEDLSSRSLLLPLVFVGGFMLALVAGIFTWFELQRLSRLQQADEHSQGSFVMPFVITRQLPGQADDALDTLGRRDGYLPRQRHALLAADRSGVEVRTGWGFRAALALSSELIRSVELGTIAFPLGDAVSVDLIIDTPRGDHRLSFMPTRPSSRFWGTERTEVIERYVEELRSTIPPAGPKP
jgi:hypothetical protein